MLFTQADYGDRKPPPSPLFLKPATVVHTYDWGDRD